MSNDVFQKPAGRLESVSKDVGFDVPVESVALPSKGLVYPVESQLANVEELQIKCMTAREEDILTSRALIKAGTALDSLLKACLLNKAIDTEEMLSGDRNALLVAVRISGYGPEYDATVKCKECKRNFDHQFVFNNIKIKRLGATPIQPNTNSFSFKLPFSKKEVVFKLLNGKDEAAVTAEVTALKKVSPLVEQNVTTRLLHSVISIEGKSAPEELRKMIFGMRSGDARALREYMDKIDPGIDMAQFLSCPHCYTEQEVEVPLGVDFFWPDVK